MAEQETTGADERSKRTWNSSTKLVQPRRSVLVVKTSERQTQDAPQSQTERARTHRQTRILRRSKSSGQRGEEHEDANDQQTLTRELLERAVSTAFGGLLRDSTIDATAFPDVHESSELSSMPDKENAPPVENPATKLEARLRSTLEASTGLSVAHRQRRREHAEVLQQATEETRATREFQRRMKHAAFEHRERKLAVHALQARIQREIQFLVAAAADLEKREFLLDDAFESYEQALQLELGLVDSASASSKQERVEASPQRSF